MIFARFRFSFAGFAAAAAVAAPAFGSPEPARIGPAPWSVADRSLALQVLRAEEGSRAPEAGADDATIAAAVTRYAARELAQDIHPDQIHYIWAISPQRRDIGAEMEAARARGGLAAWLASLPPQGHTYVALGEAERRYEAIVAQGGWAQIPKGPVLKLGDHHAQAALLRARLEAEGYGALSSEDPERFDAPLQQALAVFQRRHVLADDGRLDQATRQALNVTAEERLMQIRANRERIRWLPHQMPADRIDVDIAGARARLMQAGQRTITMKIVVGQPTKQTPMFASRVEAVIFNPPWNVPVGIARSEILPKAAKHPGYLARNDFVFVHGRLQQKAGPKSALGTVKFDLDNPFGVYLHDTPTKSAFDRRVRALSHGCMRLEKPRELAEHLLGRQGWTPDMVSAAIDAKTTRRVALKTPMPVFVVYRTAVLNEAGELEFRPDVYGWDRELAAVHALAEGDPAAAPGAP